MSKNITQKILVSLALLIVVSSCRSQFQFVPGTQQEIISEPGRLVIQINKNEVYTRGNPDSLVVLKARCTLPGNQTIIWDLGDNSPQKTGESITHDYAFARSYTIKATCTNEQRGVAEQSLNVLVHYKNPMTEPKQEARCEPYFDETKNKMSMRCKKQIK